ncbi:angiopoietin-1 receptor-like isoform X2 [Ptychodera flava]|uniref:angiopoietin-1 receptor-like isoform X2 n=1 Tax=Ptychodera flava TaxID=63121 RepID=UPI003969F240
MTCDRRCSSGNSDACRRTMYCIADPYGCSCSASYGGIDCSTDCPSGMYGSGCTQRCHCINGCNRATGECNSGGCEQGWSGSKCHIPDSCDDGFYGELCEYKCHCQDNAACDKTTGVCSNGQCAPGWMDVNITDCQQDGSPTILSLHNIKVNPGEQTSIICTIIGNPVASPDDVTLVDQSGFPVTRTSHSYTGKYLSMTNFGSLIVDNGRSYTCRVGSRSKDLTAFNEYALPTFSPSNIPQITLQATQVIVTWEKWVVGDDLGEGPAEAYKVYFKKTTDVDWTQHQNFQVVDQDQTTYTTDITGLDWSTSYDFTVTVKRPGLRGEGSMETVTTAITLCDVPSEGPTIAGATSSNPNELLITLEVPDSSKVKCDDGYIRNFHFKHRQANAKDEYLEESANDGNARTFSLTGFLAYTEYELMASFNNRDEQSPWSSIHKARTAEDLPTKPRNVALKPAVFVIEVLWSIPYPTNGIIRKYTIMYWETSKKATTTEVKELKENLLDFNTYLITNLTYKVSYSVQVAAYTSRGQGALSEMISAETTEAIPATPTNVQVIDIKDKEIELTWTEPYPFSGYIEYYGISYSSVESVFKGMQRQFKSFLVKGSISAFTIEDLSPGTIYEININASTVKGFGEATTLSTGTPFTVDISTTLSMTEDIKNDINNYGTLTQVSLPPLSEDFGISPETSLLSYVVVLEYDQSPNTRRKRDIDISKLGEFNETGPPYYITALLPLHDLPKKFIFGDGGIHGGFTNVPLTIGRQYGVYYGLKSDITGEPLYHFDDHPSIRFTASFQESTSQCSSTTTIIVTVIALILIFCLVIVLVFIVRRQNQMKSPLKHEEVQFRSSGRKPEEKKMSRLELKEKQDKSQEGFHDDDHQYAYVNVSTQQSADLTSARKPQKGQQDNGDRLYTGLQKELKSESEYTTLNLS